MEGRLGHTNDRDTLVQSYVKPFPEPWTVFPEPGVAIHNDGRGFGIKAPEHRKQARQLPSEELPWLVRLYVPHMLHVSAARDWIRPIMSQDTRGARSV